MSDLDRSDVSGATRRSAPRPGRRRILFAAHAPVDFVCFRPVYERLREERALDIYFTGGHGRGEESGAEAAGESPSPRAPQAGEPVAHDAHDAHDCLHDPANIFRPFGIEKSRILKPDVARRRAFDMVLCGHLSPRFIPERVGTRVQIFHGLSFRNLALRSKVRAYDYLFVLGPYMMRGLRERGFLERGGPRALEIGYPKLDRLADGSVDRTGVLRRLRLSGKRPVLLYAPTGDRYNSLETRGEAIIEAIRCASRFDLVIKPHDHPKDRPLGYWLEWLRRFENAHTRIVRDDLDVVPYLAAADLLITDASSVANEYAILDRPIVFFDVPRLIAHARKRQGAVDLRTWGRRGGITVRTPEALVPAIDCSLAHPGRKSAVRRALARDLFYEPGRATERAVDWILGHLGLASPRPVPPGEGAAAASRPARRQP